METIFGSPRSISASDSSQEATCHYDAFGNSRGITGTIYNPYQFTGQQLDTETGLYFLRARYYDPMLGLFLSKDPSNNISVHTPYLYTDNNPINRFDPTGLDWLNNLFNAVGNAVNWATQKISQIQTIADVTFTYVALM